MKGPDVLFLQQLLEKAGVNPGTLDGRFGPLTQKAVQQLQQKNGLYPNGMVGPEIWSILNEGASQQQSPGNILITVDVDWRRLYYSAPGKPLQNYPVAVGKPQTPTPLGNWRIIQKTVNPGGPFGVRWMRLSVPWGGYGIHGTNNPKSIGRAASHGCIRMYNADVIKLYDMTPLWTPVVIIGKAYTGRILKLGSRGSDVSGLQEKLKKLSYYQAKIDGYFGPVTEQAVINFQTDQHLNVDGIVGPETNHALQRELDILAGDIEP
ncbi:L,D-transpeptidase family protein [Syntrophomonas erecta]